MLHTLGLIQLLRKEVKYIMLNFSIILFVQLAEKLWAFFLVGLDFLWDLLYKFCVYISFIHKYQLYCDFLMNLFYQMNTGKEDKSYSISLLHFTKYFLEIIFLHQTLNCEENHSGVNTIFMGQLLANKNIWYNYSTKIFFHGVKSNRSKWSSEAVPNIYIYIGIQKKIILKIRHFHTSVNFLNEWRKLGLESQYRITLSLFKSLFSLPRTTGLDAVPFGIRSNNVNWGTNSFVTEGKKNSFVGAVSLNHMLSKYKIQASGNCLYETWGVLANTIL